MPVSTSGCELSLTTLSGNTHDKGAEHTRLPADLAASKVLRRRSRYRLGSRSSPSSSATDKVATPDAAFAADRSAAAAACAACGTLRALCRSRHASAC